ncbi:MAG: hypothetical protein AAF391_10405 [Bacteroidota bacterium]
MRRILLEYRGQKVKNSEVQHHYITRTGKSGRPKNYYFSQMLIPYNVAGSYIEVTQTATGVTAPFDLTTIKKPSGLIDPEEKVFVLVNEDGHFMLNDPLTDNLYPCTRIELLQIWDVYYPILEEYFKRTHKYHVRYKVRYLTESEIKLLTI